MAIERKMPPAEVVQADVDAGLTDRDIAEKHAVSIETVRSFRHRYHIARGPRRDPYIPWAVKKEHSTNIALRHLRNYGRRQRGIRLTPDRVKQLEEFLAYMDGGNQYGVPLVVNYDPDVGVFLEPSSNGDKDYVRQPA